MTARRWIYTDAGVMPIDLDADIWRALKARAAAVGIDWHTWITAQLEGVPPGTDRSVWLERVLLASDAYQPAPVEADELA